MTAMNSCLVVTLAAMTLAFAPMKTDAQVSRELGAKIGWAHSIIAGDDVEGALVSRRSGLSAGLFARQNVLPAFAVQLEALYNEKGAENDTSGQTLELAYLEFPLLGVGKLPLGPVQVQAHAGFSLAFTLSAKVDGTSIKDDVKGTDWSGIAGLGVELPLEATRISGEARWTWGLGTINGFDPPLDVKNKTFQVLLGATLPF